MNLSQMTTIIISSGITLILLACMYLLNLRPNRQLRRELASLQQDDGQLQEKLASLQKDEKRSRSLLKTLPSIVFTGYLDGSAEFFNDKFEGLTGYPVEEFNSHRMKWRDIILPEDVAHAKAAFKEALIGDRSYMREYRIKTASGNIRWIRERGHINCDVHGKVEYITGICSDITKEQEITAAVEKMRHQNEIILNSLGDGLFELDGNGEVSFINPAALKMLGYQGRGGGGAKPARADPSQEGGRQPLCRGGLPHSCYPPGRQGTLPGGRGLLDQEGRCPAGGLQDHPPGRRRGGGRHGGDLPGHHLA